MTEHWEMQFPNGYGASVITLRGGYEVAVLAGQQITYHTPVTDDVVRCADPWETIQQIAELPARLGFTN